MTSPILSPSDLSESQDPEAHTYTLLQSGPAVPSEEVELGNAYAVEVRVLWGSSTLHVSHLSPTKSFYVGESQAGEDCDFLLPEEKIGVARMPLVVGYGSEAAVVLPPGATGYVEMSGRPRQSLEQARHQARPCSTWDGAEELLLPLGATAHIELADLVFRVAAVRAGKPIRRALVDGVDRSAAGFFGLSLLSFASLATAMAYFLPPLGLEDDEQLMARRQVLVQQYLSAAAEREQEQARQEPGAEARREHADRSGQQAAGESGAMGKTTRHAKPGGFALQGPRDNPDPHLARAHALQEARNFGVIGMLSASFAGDPNVPTAVWGRDTFLGTDDVNAHGNLWGDDIHDAGGTNGLTLTGLGEGGGRRGVGVGLDGIGTIGAAIDGTGGLSRGRLPENAHRSGPPTLRMSTPTVSGRLPPEVIQRIVRQNFGRFRMCYEQGLRHNPNLTGRVGVRFVIGRDGAVSNVSNGGSDLPDSSVVSCVLSSFYGISFPPPEGGIVAVTYPLMFSQG